MGSEEPLSIDVVRRSDLFPPVILVSDDPNLQVPFPCLLGEQPRYIGRSAEGVITITNFRINVCQRKSFVNVPLRIIESVEIRDIFYLVLLCKDATTVRCLFSTNEDCQQWFKRVVEMTATPKDLGAIFAFVFYAKSCEHPAALCPSQEGSGGLENAVQLCAPSDESQAYSFGKDVERMKFDISNKKVWRILQINDTYTICRSYPRLHIVPQCISDETMKNVASFRSSNRFPSVVWRDQRNGAVIVRCSQPELGWLGWRNYEDEALCRSIPETCAKDPGTLASEEKGDNSKPGSVQKMLLIDCRSYSAAIANRAKGGGCESTDYYTNCDIQFMNLPNIHTIRKSFQALRLLCSTYPDHANWLSGLEACKWLQYVGAIIRVTLTVVTAIDVEAKPVLIHCSDGWDRTPQVSALAQLLLDPFYRTIQGFQWLVEREWVGFGHKFADRCGHTVAVDDPNERAPVFLQWLDCVFQLTRQFPCAFQFNEAFLVKLVQHSHSCLFGTFLFNTICEREQETTSNPTASVWSLLHAGNLKFLNPLYCPAQDRHVLYPEYGMHRLQLWSSVYLSSNSLQTSAADDFATTLDLVQTPDKEASLPRTRSCDNLTLAVATSESSPAIGRRLSDPSVACGEHLALLTKELDYSDSRYTDDNSPVASDSNSSRDTESGAVDVEHIHVGKCGIANTSDTALEHVNNTQLAGVSAVADMGGQAQPLSSVDVTDPQQPETYGVSENMGSQAQPLDAVDVADPQQTETYGVPENVVGHALPLAAVDVADPQQTETYGVPENMGGQAQTFSLARDEVMGGEAPDVHGAYCDVKRDDGKSQPLYICGSDNDKIIQRAETRLPVTQLDTASGSVPQTNGWASGKEVEDRLMLHEDVSIQAVEVVAPCQANLAGETLLPLACDCSVESSTDTLTGDTGEDVDSVKQCRKESLSTLCISHNGFSLPAHAHCEEHSGDMGGRGVTVKKRDLNLQSLHLVHQKSSSMSTSTTDISDSSIATAMCPTSGLGSHVRLSRSAGVCGGSVAGRHTPSSEPSVSLSSLGPAPVSPCTPTSTSSPAPGAEAKESPLSRQLNSVGRHLDCDGLTRFVDPSIERVQQMERTYQQRIAELEMQLALARQHLLQLAPCCNGAGRAVIDPSELQGFLHESPDGGELSSLGTVSNPASDVSWEQVDERDSKITLWVPDHVVTHCASCDGPFWLGRRKHHCRNCGKIYCGACSNYFAPVPAQHLAEPVRLCHRCYAALHLQGPGAASDDSRIAAIVVAE